MSELIQQAAGFFRQIPESDRDLIAELLADRRSPNTRRAYARDLKDFFLTATGQEPSPTLVAQFLRCDRAEAISGVLRYKASLIAKGLSENTVNRRLAAIKSLVRYAEKVGKCEWNLEGVQGEKVRAYRDTSGVDAATYQKILGTCDRDTLSGKRDYAILRLLWDNVLRRSEVSKTNIIDFDSESMTLQILGKGRGTQAETVSLSAATVDAIAQWLIARGETQPEQPLFCALDNAHSGHRLSGNAIYKIVRNASGDAGVKKIFSPHRIRHSGITAYLDASGGDVRGAKKLSRHADMNTLLIYDDNRINQQAIATNVLSGLVQAGTLRGRMDPALCRLYL